ncbi:TetR family transcriptional regulator [Lachnotalea glycerini]|uniref:TetR family transcriptional regulator n=1 Tax=Lachnotalea glycerini TaxID=1763509 RepID=A0A255IS39_9FIRM|nr:TetR/AcrR family transcriptional regulator [Lachnotalea glycerini]PXV87850.1 TetR family transcriptional regulator [Lachnotalea glycerini]RDY30263.1 TetR/AcrR family transcriptional regulator [Lachnotalea glycerini]
MKQKNDSSKLTSRDLQAIERRAQILESAKELFALNGYHATTTREITKHIGMADGLIYHYFPEGKMQILNTILNDFLDERYLRIETDIASIKEDVPIREMLIDLGNIFFTYIAKDKNVLMILLREKNIFAKSYTEKFGRHMKILTEQTMKALEQRAIKNEIRSMDFFMMTNQFWSAIYSYIVQDILFQQYKMYAVDKETYLEEIVDYTLLTWKIS